MAGKLLFPAFPRTGALPWVLGGVSLAVVGFGLVSGDGTATTVGAVGLGGCIVAFPVARLLLGAGPDRTPPEHDPPRD